MTKAPFVLMEAAQEVDVHLLGHTLLAAVDGSQAAAVRSMQLADWALFLVELDWEVGGVREVRSCILLLSIGLSRGGKMAMLESLDLEVVLAVQLEDVRNWVSPGEVFAYHPDVEVFVVVFAEYCLWLREDAMV
jgi:hypothetical protein